MFPANQPYMTGQFVDLPLHEVFKILSGQTLDRAKVICMPPVLPKGGEVFVYCPPSEDPKHQMDFRFDQYRWVSKGSNVKMSRKHLPRVLKRYYYLKDPDGSDKQTLPGFKKHVYCLREATGLKKLYLIHYIGNEALHRPPNPGAQPKALHQMPALESQPTFELPVEPWWIPSPPSACEEQEGQLLPPGIKMEEPDLKGSKASEVSEAGGRHLHAVGAEAGGEVLRGSSPFQVKQELEERLQPRWDAQWQNFLKPPQFPHLGWKTPLQLEPTLGGHSKDFQASANGAPDSSQWPREECETQSLPDCDTYENSPDSPVKVKQEILEVDPLRLEMHCHRFRDFRYRKVQGPQESWRQLQELCHLWLMPERHTKEQILELVILEQFLAILPQEMQSWVKEHRPETCAQAVMLAEDFQRSLQEPERATEEVPGMNEATVATLSEEEQDASDVGEARLCTETLWKGRKKAGEPDEAKECPEKRTAKAKQARPKSRDNLAVGEGDLHIVQVGPFGEYLEEAAPPPVKLEQEEGLHLHLDAQQEELARTKQSSHLGGRDPQMHKSGEPVTDCQSPPKEMVGANQCHKGTCVAQTLIGLSGEVQPACGSAGFSEQVKEDLKTACDISDKASLDEETSLDEEADNSEVRRQRFRQFRYPEAMRPRDVCKRLWELCHQWLRPERRTKEQILDLLILEKFLTILPIEMDSWVRDREPATCAQAAALAEVFLLRPQEPKRQKILEPSEDDQVPTGTLETMQLPLEAKEEDDLDISLLNKYIQMNVCFNVETRELRKRLLARQRQRRHRARQTPEQRLQRRRVEAERNARRRATETPEQAAIRRQKDAQRKFQKRKCPPEPQPLAGLQEESCDPLTGMELSTVAPNLLTVGDTGEVAESSFDSLGLSTF